MIQLAFGAIGALGWGTKLAMAGALFLALATAYGVWHHTVWERGYARAISDIARADGKAVKRATDARNAIVDCRSRGLRWDQSTGQCSGG